jgi:transmembrane sensor
MSDLAKKVEEAADNVQVEWTEGRARRVEAMMFRTKTRRARVRVGATMVAALAIAVGGVAFYKRSKPVNNIATTPAPTVQPLKFADGSTATPLDMESVVQSTSVAPDKIEVAIVKGAARFEVTKNPQRVFRVVRGNVAVEVLGTAFTVQPVDGGTKVFVEHGRVRVQCNETATEITDGESSVCPTLVAPPAQTTAVAPPAPSPSAVPSVVAASPWKSLAHEGDYDKAFEALKMATVKDEPNELLQAADVARLSHHPAQAVPHLKRVIDQHSGDPRAPLAAFTLGRVLLEELGQPKQAAEAFAKSRSLSPGGTLAEDALAREVEAWSKAGDPGKAKTRAEEYVDKYPKGLRIKSVKKFGGIE